MAITGAAGQLGSALVDASTVAGHETIALTRADLDLLDPSAEERVAQLDVDWVAHCAAYTAVDRAESEKDLAHEINCEGSAAVARGAQRSGARLLYVSTDYVFDGRACEPYIPDAPTGPVNVYGVTKRAGEQAVERDHAAPLTVRTSWIMGGQGPNFAATMMQLGRERDALSVIDDQRGRPTWAPDLAPGLVRLMEAQAVGVLHLANEGEATWFELAESLFDQARAHDPCAKTPSLRPTTTQSWGAPARRPAYSVLDLTRARDIYGVSLPHWREGLHRAVEKYS